MLGSALIDEVARRYGLRAVVDRELSGGEESRVVRIVSGDRAFVLRVSPSWRTLGELSWAYALARHAALHIPEALAPMAATDGNLAFEHQGHVVSVFPFVDGDVLDRASDRERDSAARLLARLHQVLPMWPEATPRPPSHPKAQRHRPARDPDLADAELDELLTRLAAATTPALVHGDFYRGNLRCLAGRIVGLFDWDDARYSNLEQDLAWSVWEFAQADHRATLDLRRARSFLDRYAASSGPVSLTDCTFIVPLIRHGLRMELRHASAMAAAGQPDDPSYLERSRAAFHALRTCVLA